MGPGLDFWDGHSLHDCRGCCYCYCGDDDGGDDCDCASVRWAQRVAAADASPEPSSAGVDAPAGWTHSSLGSPWELELSLHRDRCCSELSLSSPSLSLSSCSSSGDCWMKRKCAD